MAGYNPYEQQLVGYEQQKKTAQKLREAAMQSPQGQMVSGYYVAPSWSQYLAQGLQGYLANKQEQEAQSKIEGVGKERQAKIAELLRGMIQPKQEVTGTVQMPVQSVVEGALTQAPGMNQQPSAAQGQQQPSFMTSQGAQGAMQAAMPEGYSAPQMQAPQQMAQSDIVQQKPMTMEDRLPALAELAQIDPQAAQLYASHFEGQQTRAENAAARKEQLLAANQSRLEQLQQQQQFQAQQAELNRQNQQALARQASADRRFIAGLTHGGQSGAGGQSGNVKLSPTQQKELFESDELAQSSQNAAQMLRGALDLNKKAYSGVGATERAKLRGYASGLLGESPEANATVNLNNLMQGQALESLKATFGGNPTEGERKILLELQASADKTPAQREEILNRAIQAADRRAQFNLQKSQAIRTGQYGSAGYSPVLPPAQPQQPALSKGGAKFLGFE